MDHILAQDELEAVKKSYLNILAFFLKQPKIDASHVRCLLKWGFQLHLHPREITIHDDEFDQLTFRLPETKMDRFETVYHLVYLINMDKAVEDIELELASHFAAQLGFPETMVGDLLKSIATAVDDDEAPHRIRQDVLEFLKVYSL